MLLWAGSKSYRASIVFRLENGGARAVGFGDDPEANATLGHVGRQQPESVLQRQYELLFDGERQDGLNIMSGLVDPTELTAADAPERRLPSPPAAHLARNQYAQRPAPTVGNASPIARPNSCPRRLQPTAWPKTAPKVRQFLVATDSQCLAGKQRCGLYELNSWQRHESRVVEVFAEALSELAHSENLPADENRLNRQLLFLARRANYRLVRAGRGTNSNIIYEASNQPLVSDEERASRESKRPDFQCGLVDANAELDFFLAIECKRLGTPSSPAWVFNQNYIANGIARFENPEWGYGADCPSGVMIGYIQSMDLESIRIEVNDFGQRQGFSQIANAAYDPNTRRVCLGQTLNRRTTPTRFTLRHLWIDLRAS